jgi:dTDP-4-amino-4,6-dideoxygalactose transaminase
MSAALPKKPLHMSALRRLALDGGTPQLASNGVASWPQFTSDNDLAVLRAARRADEGATSLDRAVSRTPNEVNTPAGPLRRTRVTQLERAWSAVTGRADVVACSSGEVAARLLTVGLELEVGDEVILPAGAPLAAAIVSMGAVPVYVDVDPQTLHLDPTAAEAALSGKTRAVMAVDRYGTTADYRQLECITRRAGITLVEDGSSSIGASFERRPVGALGTTSICVLRNHATGLALGTGALYATDDPTQGANAQRLLLVHDPLCSDLTMGDGLAGRDAPVPRVTDRPGSATSFLAHLSGPIAMSDLDATVALDRLDAVEHEVAVRAINGAHLRKALDQVPGIWMPQVVRGASHTYASFPLVVVPDELGLPESAVSALRDTLVDCVTAEGLWIDSAQRRGQPTPGEQFPVLDAAIGGGLILGDARSPLTAAAGGTGDMDRVAECFVKILVENVDRVRQLTLDRAAGHRAS